MSGASNGLPYLQSKGYNRSTSISSCLTGSHDFLISSRQHSNLGRNYTAMLSFSATGDLTNIGAAWIAENTTHYAQQREHAEPTGK